LVPKELQEPLSVKMMCARYEEEMLPLVDETKRKTISKNI